MTLVVGLEPRLDRCAHWAAAVAPPCPTMSNLFSSDPFLLAAAAAFYPGERAEIVPVAVMDHHFRLLRTNRRLHTQLPFADFVEPEVRPGRPSTLLPFLPLVRVADVPIESWEAVAAARHLAPAPWVDWQSVSSWPEYVRQRRAHRPEAFSAARKARRLERDLGPLRLEFAAADRDLIDRCATWKSAQYQRTGFVDMFAHGGGVRLFHHMFDQGALVVSALRAGDRAVAIHLGALVDQRFYSWITAYDTALATYSPGAVLLERMLAESYRLGHREFDFLIGGESYKFCYATDVRLIGPLGRPGRGVRLWHRLRQAALAQVRRHANLYAALQRVKRWYVQRQVP